MVPKPGRSLIMLVLITPALQWTSMYDVCLRMFLVNNSPFWNICMVVEQLPSRIHDRGILPLVPIFNDMLFRSAYYPSLSFYRNRKAACSLESKSPSAIPAMSRQLIFGIMIIVIGLVILAIIRLSLDTGFSDSQLLAK